MSNSQYCGIIKESIELKDLLIRHSKFFKDKKVYDYELADIYISNFLGRYKEDENIEISYKEDIEKRREYKLNISCSGPLCLKLSHEGNNISCILKIGDFWELSEFDLERSENIQDILENFYIEVKKIGKLTKTKEGFNLKINMYDAFRYRGANIFVYIKDESFEKIRKIKQMALDSGFLENEIIYDIEGYNNFRSMYERSLKEGDLVVIPDLSMIDNDLKSLEEFFLNFIDKKISFCIDDYVFLLDLYEELTKEEIISLMIKFFEFYLKKIKNEDENYLN